MVEVFQGEHNSRYQATFYVSVVHDTELNMAAVFLCAKVDPDDGFMSKLHFEGDKPTESSKSVIEHAQEYAVELCTMLSNGGCICYLQTSRKSLKALNITYDTLRDRNPPREEVR